jgi:DNA-binding response OmpR family regulator
MTATTTTPTAKAPKALLLAHDPARAAALEAALLARGFEVRAAADGLAGTALLLDLLLDLDVVVMEHDLSGRDASALVHLVRGPGGEDDLGLVVVLPGEAPVARVHLLAAGADAVTGPSPAAAADGAVEAVARRARARSAPAAAPRPAPAALRTRTLGAFRPFPAHAALPA